MDLSTTATDSAIEGINAGHVDVDSPRSWRTKAWIAQQLKLDISAGHPGARGWVAPLPGDAETENIPIERERCLQIVGA